MHARSSTETRINLRIMVRFTNDVLLSRDYLRIGRELRRTANEKKRSIRYPNAKSTSKLSNDRSETSFGTREFSHLIEVNKRRVVCHHYSIKLRLLLQLITTDY